jgi:hypothetical protein
MAAVLFAVSASSTIAPLFRSVQMPEFSISMNVSGDIWLASRWFAPARTPIARVALFRTSLSGSRAACVNAKT